MMDRKITLGWQKIVLSSIDEQWRQFNILLIWEKLLIYYWIDRVDNCEKKWSVILEDDYAFVMLHKVSAWKQDVVWNKSLLWPHQLFPNLVIQ